MRERQSGSKALEEGLLGMGNRHWMEIECFHRLGAPESKRLKDAPPNLWEASRYRLIGRFPASRPPDRLFPFAKSLIFHVTTQSHEGVGGGIFIDTNHSMRY